MSPITTPERTAVLEQVADAVLRLPADGVARVGIDGIDGSGKTTFADELVPLIETAGRPVIRASADGFHRPKSERYRLGRASPEGFYRDSYDYEALRSALLDPLSPGGSGRYRRAVFDVEADRPVDCPEEGAEPGAVLVFDGIFLHRPELRGYWDLSVYLDVAWENNHHLPNAPEGWPVDPEHPKNRRYVEGQRIYFRECRPWERADIVIDNEDLSSPRFLRG